MERCGDRGEGFKQTEGSIRIHRGRGSSAVAILLGIIPGGNEVLDYRLIK